MKKLTTIAVLVAASILAGCYDKNAVLEIAGPAEGARIKFFNFGINAPSVNFYANDNKVTAITSGTGIESTTGTSYGLASSGGYYNILTPGSYSFNGRIAATTDKDLQVVKLTTTIENQKAYSFYVTGFYDATAKMADAFVVEDVLSAAMDWNNATVRFVNASPNSQPMTLYAKNTTTLAELPVGTLVAYKAAGVFTALPPATYDISVRVAGSSTNTVLRTAVSFLAGRTYTITARGDVTIAYTSTATNRPILDNTQNR